MLINIFLILEPLVTSSTPNPVIKPSTNVDTKGQSSFLPLIVGAIGGCALLFLIFILVFIALKKRRDMVQNQREGKMMMMEIN